MRNLLGAFVAAVLSVVPFPGVLAADQPPALAAGRGRAAGARNFDPATVATVSGEVSAVRVFDGRCGQGVHVDLATDAGVLDVHLAPSSYLAKQHLEVATGDALEVTGSKVELAGKPALIAQSVRKGEARITLRDAQGIPAWAGRGPR
jgi:hypothetical protein